MSESARRDEWIRQAYQLAGFIHRDAAIARHITISAMTKVEVAAAAQYKRLYYTPTGRTPAQRAARNKVSLSDLQLLQRLVYIESEPYERQKEQGRELRAGQLLVHFIKHLVRITLKRNSFYVTLGLSRILHAYATTETMEIYNAVVQDPERVHDDYYYRSRKGQLMRELKERFGEFLALAKGARGEERFQTAEDSASHAATVTECLNRFTPWSTACVMPDRFDPLSDVIPPLSFNGSDPDAEHRVEVNRIHAALHPRCYSKLVTALGLASPEHKLEVPKFLMEQHNTQPPDERPNPPPLATDELEAIKAVLAAEAASRRAASCGLLRIVVDGDEYAQLDTLLAGGRLRFELGEEAELIEVRAVEKSGDVLLATHLLSFAELDDAAQPRHAAVVLEGGQKLSFRLSPTRNPAGEITGSHCEVAYQETNWLRAAALSARRLRAAVGLGRGRKAQEPASGFSKPAWVALLLACVAGLFIYWWSQHIDPEQPKLVKVNDAPLPVTSIRRAPPLPVEAPDNHPRPKPLPSGNRLQNRREPTPQRRPPAPESQPQVAVSNGATTATERLGEGNQRRVLRIALAESPSAGVPEESNPVLERGPVFGLKLGAVRRIYVETDGDEALGQRVLGQLQNSLRDSHRFMVAPDKEQAEALLKVFVRRESGVPGDEPERERTSVIVRLINADGYVIWPARRHVSGWKYVGPAAQLPPRILRDLWRDAVRATGQASQP